MTDKELIEYCEQGIKTDNYISFEDEVFQEITEEQAALVASIFSKDTFMLLPDYEIKFFEWLKAADFEVWNDLWNDEAIPPYLVGAYFLPKLIKKDGRGFPICDLTEIDNYYFTMAQMPDEESKVVVETAKTRFMNKEKLTAAHLLALEISMDPIDIWHFAYKHNISLKIAKNAVAELVDDKVLVHLTKAEHLALFLNF